MHQDQSTYHKFTRKERVDKAVNTLNGIIEGISIDGQINTQEVAFLVSWANEHNDLQEQHPINELLPVVARALEDGILTPSERDDIHWLCQRLRSTEYVNQITADLQRLQAVVSGIAADDIITMDELSNLSDWLAEHEDLRTCYPYDEIDSLIVAAMADHQISSHEHAQLLNFFRDFSEIGDHRTIQKTATSDPVTVAGICAVCPEIRITGSLICFTGASERYTRHKFSELVTTHGGLVTDNVSKKLKYLVIGAQGNPCWAYACYGRKVETVVTLRKQGHPILIVHENDFHDAIAS
jgi:hypothetical protein